MKLGPEHIPFPESIRDTVLANFLPPPDEHKLALQDQHLDMLEAIRYLRDITDFRTGAGKGIAQQTEAIGDPAVLAPDPAALVAWVDKAFDIFEQDAPLEPELAGILAQLRPVAAAVAISDPRFCVPGNHPLHQLLDALNAAAIGWLPSLGRSGQTVKKLFERATADARLWFTDPESSLSSLADDIIRQTAKDLARAQRMSQRVVDTERGRARASSARALATRSINTLLQDHLAPAEVGEFLKGPWFDSLQLVVLKFGADSPEWEQANQTTQILLDTLQDRTQDENRRQYIFSTVPKIPQHLRRWLLSLQHDPEAVNDAISLVEYAHMRILRRQDLELTRIEPLPEVADQTPRVKPLDASQQSLIDRLEPGQWFHFVSDAGESDRLQLALKLDEQQQLLFTNQAGVKAGEYSFADFANLIAGSSVRKLPREYAFTLSLAAAAGIKTQADLLKVSPLAARQARERAQEEQAQSLEANSLSTRQQQQLETEAAATARQAERLAAAASGGSVHRQAEKLERQALQEDKRNEAIARRETLDTAMQEEDKLRSLNISLEDESPGEPEGDEEEVLELTLDPGLGEEDGFYDLTEDDQLVEEVQFPEPPGFDGMADDIKGEAAAPEMETAGTSTSAAPASDAGFLQPAGATLEEQAHEPTTPAAEADDFSDVGLELDEIIAAAASDAVETTTESLELDDIELAGPAPQPAVDSAKADALARRLQATEAEQRPAQDLDIPMGSWLGFHDQHMPLMAKLAVHDRERDVYIFVNREGIKLRELSRQELDDLVNRNLVELLEARSNFREALAALRTAQSTG